MVTYVILPPAPGDLLHGHLAHLACSCLPSPAAKADVLSEYDASQPWSETNFDPNVKVRERSSAAAPAAGERYLPTICCLDMIDESV